MIFVKKMNKAIITRHIFFTKTVEFSKTPKNSRIPMTNDKQNNKVVSNPKNLFHNFEFFVPFFIIFSSIFVDFFYQFLPPKWNLKTILRHDCFSVEKIRITLGRFACRLGFDRIKKAIAKIHCDQPDATLSVLNEWSSAVPSSTGATFCPATHLNLLALPAGSAWTMMGFGPGFGGCQ